MDLVTMILACSMYPDNSLVNAMVEVGSKNNPLTITVEGGDIKTFQTAQEAADFYQQEVAKGLKLDVGLMQIPSTWIHLHATDPKDLFLPCKNMVLATKILDRAAEKCADLQNTGDSDPETCMLSIYKTNDPSAGLDYAKEVLDYAKKNSFNAIEAAAEAKNPRGFNMIPGDAPTNAATQNATHINPTTDKIKKLSDQDVDVKQ